MLFLQPLDRFLPRWPASEWEYAFTVYDKQHKAAGPLSDPKASTLRKPQRKPGRCQRSAQVPWGINEEVAQTRNGFMRFNAGVQFFRQLCPR